MYIHSVLGNIIEVVEIGDLIDKKVKYRPLISASARACKVSEGFEFDTLDEANEWLWRQVRRGDTLYE